MTEKPASPAPLIALRTDALAGRFATPGDPAISHRALIVAALAVGRTSIEGLLDGADVMATIAALRQLGVRIEAREGTWQVHGLGVNGLLEPAGPLDLGDAGTAAPLLLGLLAPYDFTTTIKAGGALPRPLLEALGQLGARAETADDDASSVTLRGAAVPLPVRQAMAQPSEAVKSALLLAGLQIAGTTVIVEPVPTLDHTEKLLAAFGADIAVRVDEQGGASIRLTGLPDLRAGHVSVPGDPSLAAPAIVAALIVPGSDLLVENVLINPTRTGLIDTLLQMGGDIAFINQREAGGEHVADLRVRSSRMKAITVDGAHAQAMLDDIPALAIAAAYAEGETMIGGLGELRLGACDRLAATAAGLAANRVTVTEGEDSLRIVGNGKVDGGGTVVTRHDPAIAMSFVVLGLASKHKVTVDDASAIAARFPHFVSAMHAIGARLEPGKGR